MANPLAMMSTNSYKSVRDTARRGVRDACCCMHARVTLREATTRAVIYTHNALSFTACQDWTDLK